MFVFRNSWRDENGETVYSQKWTIGFADHRGAPRRLPGFTSKRESESLGRTLENLVAARVSGQPLSVELERWIAGLPDAIRTKLGAWGLLDPARVAAGKTIAEHMADWKAFLTSRGNTGKHVETSASHVRRIADSCKFTNWTDVSAARVVDYLNKIRARGTSARTANSHLQSIKSFARWMCKDGRAAANPLAHLQGQNVRTDRRRIRRPLAVDEIKWLLATTERQPECQGLAGMERVLLYRLGVETGLRAHELATLTRESLRLDTDPPTITVAAGYSKHRREDTLPIREDTAADVRLAIAALLPGVPLFRFYKAPRYAEMLRADLAAARDAWLEDAKTPAGREKRDKTDFLKYVDTAGRYADFHGLRHTCGTLLAAANVHPQVAQSLLRHSTIDLTMSLYTHPYAEQQTDAIASLPDFGAKKKARKTRAQGTT